LFLDQIPHEVLPKEHPTVSVLLLLVSAAVPAFSPGLSHWTDCQHAAKEK
jgi:hypothetical protein